MQLLSTLVLCSLALLVPTQSQSGPQIIFSKSYEKAFEEATERGVPLMICIIQDDEEANDAVWNETINAPEFVKATLGTVNLIGNRGTEQEHGTREIEVDGQTLRLCAKFGNVTCLNHKRAEVGIFRDFARDGGISTPQVMLVLPDQTIVATLVDRHPMTDFLDAFQKAKQLLPNGLTLEGALEVRRGLKDAKTWLEQGEIGKVLQFALPLTRRKSSSLLLERVTALLRQLEQAGRKELVAVEAQLEQKQYVPAMAKLDELIRLYRRSAIESTAKGIRTELLKNREVKAALTAAKREISAAKLLENADRLAEQGKDDRAGRLYQRLRERFANTEAGRELAQRKSAEQP